MMNNSNQFEDRRKQMVKQQLADRGITDKKVLRAFKNVPREQFVNEENQSEAYSDRALPTREGQTISQPYMVASMTELLGVKDGQTILEVGTGSGYQSAILAEIGAQVFTVEKEQSLSLIAEQRIEDLGYEDQVNFKIGDGTKGWLEHKPYDGVIITAGTPSIPDSLKEQTGRGGRIVAPVGSKKHQTIEVWTKKGDGSWDKQDKMQCVFVPLVGGEGWESDER